MTLCTSAHHLSRLGNCKLRDEVDHRRDFVRRKRLAAKKKDVVLDRVRLTEIVLLSTFQNHVGDNKSPEGRAMNRRVEIIVDRAVTAAN